MCLSSKKPWLIQGVDCTDILSQVAWLGAVYGLVSTAGIVGGNGKVLGSYASKVTPDDPTLLAAIEQALR